MENKKIRVLIAEDDFFVAEEIKRALKLLPYELAGEADNGEIAIHMVEKLRPDVILMDIKMPKMNGLKAAKLIQNKCPTPIVILTAYESHSLIEEAGEAGVAAYLIKPPSPLDIQRAITVAMARHCDLMEMRRLNKKLKKTIGTVEKRIQDRTRKLEEETKRLEESNIALKVLMEHRKEDQVQLQENVLHNIRKRVFPYIEKMTQCHLDTRQEQYLKIIVENLNDIISPFAPKLSQQVATLTPAELMTADLTKQGKTTKEIAELLTLSPTTIATHKQRIRKKLGITNKKINLRTLLSSL